MTIGQRTALELPVSTDVGDLSIAPITKLDGKYFNLAARAFGIDRPQFAFYTFQAFDFQSGSANLQVYWTTAAVQGSVGWEARAATLNTGTTARVIDKAYAASNGVVSTTVLGSWRYHRTVILLNHDGLTADSLINIRLTRDASNKTAPSDAYVIGVGITYTGA